MFRQWCVSKQDEMKQDKNEVIQLSVGFYSEENGFIFFSSDALLTKHQDIQTTITVWRQLEKEKLKMLEFKKPGAGRTSDVYYDCLTEKAKTKVERGPEGTMHG